MSKVQYMNIHTEINPEFNVHESGGAHVSSLTNIAPVFFMKEIFKKIPNYSNYEVSNLGMVKSLARWRNAGTGKYMQKERILKPTIDSGGYRSVVLYNKNGRRTWHISVLIAMAFLNHEPDGYNIIVDHRNNVRTDDRLENLQLITNRENITKEIKRSLPTGVHLQKNGKYHVAIVVGFKRINLGTFETIEEASEYYQNALKAIKNGTEIKIKKPQYSSKYRNVYFDKTKKKWVANKYIGNRKSKFLGYFDTEYEAYKKTLTQ